MGVPGYYKWLLRTCPSMRVENNNKKPNCNHLFIDFNQIIYNCLSYTNQEGNIPSKELCLAIIEYIDEIVTFTKPQNTIFISVDGNSPISKLQQQRNNRFVLNTTPSSFDKSNLTPGTKFFEVLTNSIKELILNYKKNTPLWKRCSIYFSDEKVSGEGEHKIIKQINSMIEEG